MSSGPPSHHSKARGWQAYQVPGVPPSPYYNIYRRNATVMIELAQPKKRNMLNAETVHGLRDLYQKLAQESSVFRIILTGQGNVFCAGMNLGGAGNATSADANVHREQLNTFRSLLHAIEKAPQTTIALINGPCYGGGNGLAFVNDIRICTRDATFNLTEIRLGLAPCAISPCLFREWGIAFCRQAMLTGRPVTADELFRIGTLYAIADDQEHLFNGALTALENTLQGCAPGAARAVKELAEVAWRSGGEREQNEVVEKRYLEMMAPSPEARYGIESFRKGARNIDWSKRESGPKSLL